MRGLFKKLKSLRHRLAHRLGLNEGNVVTWKSYGKLFAGFQCDHCGLIMDKHEIPQHIFNPLSGINNKNKKPPMFKKTKAKGFVDAIVFTNNCSDKRRFN